MPWELASPSEDALLRWIEDSLASGSHRLAQGYQGQTLLYQDPNRRLVIKAPSGRGPMRWLSQYMLRREARIYALLKNFSAVPRCYGLLRNRYLVLDYIEGVSMRHAEIDDRDIRRGVMIIMPAIDVAAEISEFLK